MTTLFYPDVSNNQWESVDDLHTFLGLLQPQGFAGVAHKVTQGSHYQDPYWLPCLEWCIDHGFPVIGYHYLDTSDPDEQAENWRENHGTPNVMFDFERGGGTMANFWIVCDAFNSVGTNVQLGYVPNWYLNDSIEDGGAGGGDLSCFPYNGVYLVSSAYPAGGGTASQIYADGDGDAGEGWEPYNGCTPTAWQFTDQAQIGRWSVDCNAYKGANIRDLFGG